MVQRGLIEVKEKGDMVEVKLTKTGRAYEEILRGYDPKNLDQSYIN